MLTRILRVIRRWPHERMASRDNRLALHVEPRISAEDRFVLGHLATQAIRPRGIVVEVGSFLGNGSTQAILDVIRPRQGTLHCVDTWQGNSNVAWHLELARDYDLFATFRHYVAQANGTDLVKPMLMNSRDAARVLADGIADLVFIDADHAYRSVKQDIAMWMPKVRPGGILCGHDCEGRVDEIGANLVAAHLEEDFVRLPERAFGGFHPGPVQAVEELGEAAVRWAHQSLSEQGFADRRSSIWHVQIP